MNFIDFILNIVGLFLWLNWHSVYFNPSTHPAFSLVATLKGASRHPRWLYFGVLIGLLVLRALFYWQIGPALPWTPRFSLGCTTLLFRSDLKVQMLSYSFASFGATLGVFYLWLLLLSCINANVSEESPQQRMIRLHLGFLKDWPVVLKLLVPFITTGFLWCALHPALVKMQIVPKCITSHLLEQGAIFGLLVYLQATYLLVGILVLYILNSYVFIGNFSFWKFIDASAANLLRPLRCLPLVVKRIDLAPVIAIVLILETSALLTWVSKTSWAVKQFLKLAS